MHWIFLILASVCEICWLYCIRYLNNVSFTSLVSLQFLSHDNAAWIILSIAGYAGFGIANVILFSMAMKKIPAATAFGIWTGLALCGTTLADAYLLHLDFTPWQGVFMIMICAGILGLKLTAEPPKKQIEQSK